MAANEPLVRSEFTGQHANADAPQQAAPEAPVAKTRRRLFTKYVALFVAVVCIALVANGVFDVRLAVRAADVTRQLSMEHEGIVHKLCPRQVLCVHHKLVRFNPLTYRGGNRRIGGRGRPYSEPNRDRSGGNGKQGGDFRGANWKRSLG